MRDLLLWQDVYVGEGGSLQGGKEVSSSQGGSREGSENGGENASVEEIDKMQVMSGISIKCWSSPLLNSTSKLEKTSLLV